MTDPDTADRSQAPETAETGEGSGVETNYFLIFLALVICTIVSIVLAVSGVIPPQSPVLVGAFVLAIALAQTFLVLTYFMHLKFEGRWKYMMLCPVIVLATGLPISLYSDIGMHYYGWRNPVPVRRHSAATVPGAAPQEAP